MNCLFDMQNIFALKGANGASQITCGTSNPDMKNKLNHVIDTARKFAQNVISCTNDFNQKLSEESIVSQTTSSENDLLTRWTNEMKNKAEELLNKSASIEKDASTGITTISLNNSVEVLHSEIQELHKVVSDNSSSLNKLITAIMNNDHWERYRYNHIWFCIKTDEQSAAFKEQSAAFKEQSAAFKEQSAAFKEQSIAICIRECNEHHLYLTEYARHGCTSCSQLICDKEEPLNLENGVPFFPKYDIGCTSLNFKPRGPDADKPFGTEPLEDMVTYVRAMIESYECDLALQQLEQDYAPIAREKERIRREEEAKREAERRAKRAAKAIDWNDFDARFAAYMPPDLNEGTALERGRKYNRFIRKMKREHPEEFAKVKRGINPPSTDSVADKSE